MAETEAAPTAAASGASDLVDVVIVGAGPTGLMAAALLLRCGVSVRIVDKSPTQAKESRAFGIQARSMELFLKIGLAEEFLDRGLLTTGVQIVVDGKIAAELNFDDIGRRDTPYGYLLMVPQWQIEEVLAADVRRLGLSVEHGVEVTGFVQSEAGVALQATTAGGSIELRGRYLIGADGAHSVVRKALGLSFEGAPYPQTFFLADCKIDWPLDYGHFKVFVRGRSLGLYLPLKGRELGRIMVTDPSPPAAEGSVAAQGASAVSFEEIQSAFKDAAGVEVTLSDPTWTSRYRIHHRGVNRYGLGRAFVAGDAAHIHSPAGGQGMNTGLQDAANLAWKLALVLKGRADPALLDTYDSERRPVGEKVLAYTDRLFSFVAAPAGWIASIRNVVMPVFAATVSRLGFARNKAFHFISQLGIRYHESRYVQDAPSAKAGAAFRNGLSAGHRAPDAAVERGRDVFDLIGGYRFHLLALSRKPLDEPGIATLSGELAELRDGTRLDLRTHIVAHSLIGRDDRIVRAESGQVFEAYGLDETTPQALYPIRPDGYIAWRTDSLDVAACRQFIAGMTGALD